MNFEDLVVRLLLWQPFSEKSPNGRKMEKKRM